MEFLMEYRTLSIGNSFSQDACGYLHQIAASAGVNLTCVNLYIGGCSLETHAANLASKAKNYSLEVNGAATGKMVSIDDALGDGTFEVVTLQQASHFSGTPETYYPYIEILAKEIRRTQPNAKLMIHETWAYEIDSTHSAFVNYSHDQHEMYTRLRAAYTEAAEKIGAGFLPVGDIIQLVRENIPEFDYANGGESLNRDGFHLSLPVGRCLAGYVWLEVLCGVDARKALYVPEDADEKTVTLLKKLREYVHKNVNTTR